MSCVERFEGQVAIVTGSGSGIGAAIAVRMASEGAAVCVADIDLPAAESVAETIRAKGGVARAQEVDVTDRAAIKVMVAVTSDLLGPIDLLVNNAAVCNEAPLADLDEQGWDRDLDVVLKGPFLCAQAVLPGMKSAGGGSIVNLGSISWMIGQGAHGRAPAFLRLVLMRFTPMSITLRMPCAARRSSPASMASTTAAWPLTLASWSAGVSTGEL